MSATLIRVAPTPSTQVLVSWHAMPGAYLLLGRATGQLPRSGAVRLARSPGPPGMFRTFAWPLGKEEGVGFLTIVRLPERLEVSPESVVLLRGARSGDRDFSLPLSPVCGEEEFGRHLASMAAGSSIAVARFLLDLMTPEAPIELSRPALLVHSFLRHAAHHEGCVELILHVSKQLLLLQGWGPPTAEQVEIIIAGSSLKRHVATVGTFDRNDIAATLTGTILALPAEIADDMAIADAIFVLAGDTILCRKLLDSRVLDSASSIGQIRHLLPRLTCPPHLAARLQQALQPQFEGIDTLNGSTRPVRAALDVAVWAEGAGLYFSGWIFDPTACVTSIQFCDGEFATLISTTLVRIQRDDVVQAFRSNPAFPPCARSDVGFVASTLTDRARPVAPCLRLTFHDGDVAYLPLRLRDLADQDGREQLCGSVDLHKSSGLSIIQHHLAPFLASAERARPALIRVALQGPLDRECTVVLPLTTPCLPRAVIATFLNDPLALKEQLVVVCGPKWTDGQIERLADLLDFYDLSATILCAATPIGPIEAAALAAAHGYSETFILLSPTTAGQTVGTRAALRAAASGAGAVCPTVLYEDGSIRYAGATRIMYVDRAPFVRTASRFLGLSAEHIVAGQPSDAVGGTLDCCLLTRDALSALSRTIRVATKASQEIGTFVELSKCGFRIVWQPAVTVIAADDAELASAPPVAALVDNWMLRSFWGEAACAS